MNIYIIDTSSLIELQRLPRDIFVTLWDDIENLIQKEILISTEEVLEELKKKDDYISQWAKNNKKMFKKLTQEQIIEVKNILNIFPKLIDINRETPQADPFIIALALYEEPQKPIISTNRIIITNEKISRGQISKIPNVCVHFNIKCIDLFDFFREMKWKY
jgi:hypothetical protein